ncbi:MAG: energy transducer TonB [Gemmatimonadota bacterium]|jgi:TonB family protein
MEVGHAMRAGQHRWNGGSGAAFSAVSIRFAALALLFLVFTSVLGGCGGDDPIEEPTPLYGEVPIEYPLALWDANVEGITLLRVRVTDMGVVDSVEVLEGSGYPAFDSAAVRGALDLRYNPARRNGERTTVWAKVPVHFTKEDG